MEEEKQFIIELVNRIPEWGLFLLGGGYLYFKYALPKLKNGHSVKPVEVVDSQTRQDALDHQAMSIKQDVMNEKLGKIETHMGNMLDNSIEQTTLLQVIAGVKDKKDV